MQNLAAHYPAFPAALAQGDMSIEQIGQNWFVSLGEYILQFQEGQAKLTVLKKLYMERFKQSDAVCWTDIETALAREDFTMPRLTKLFTSRTARIDRIAMFVEALQQDLHRKTFGEWKIVSYKASNGDMYYALRSPAINANAA